MAEYEFTFKFALRDSWIDPSVYVEALAEADCDDALVGLGKAGRIALEFVREADNARDAVLGAFADARKALPDARLIEVSPDLVGLTDIAGLMACSRQNVRKIAMRDHTFPTAIHEGSAELFHLDDVMSWAKKHRESLFDARILEVAAVAREINLVNQVLGLRRRRIAPEIALLCRPSGRNLWGTSVGKSV